MSYNKYRYCENNPKCSASEDSDDSDRDEGDFPDECEEQIKTEDI